MKTWLDLHKVMENLKGEYNFLMSRFQIKCEWFTHALLTIVLHSVSQFKYKHGIFIQMWIFALETISGIPVHVFVTKSTGICLEFQPTKLSTANFFKKKKKAELSAIILIGH